MEYSEVDIKLKQVNPFKDVLVAKLNEINFESFSEDNSGLKAYVPTELLDIDAMNQIFSEISDFTELSFSIKKIQEKNWNENWEKNYSPVFINNNCVIRADFHRAFTDIEYQIVINPKMSFGTGHHETTSLIMKEMFNIDYNDKSVLDIGCGTGILSILASKLGANQLDAIDVDKWAFKNAKENAILNDVSNINFIYGDVNDIGKSRYDVVLANINRNVLINDIEAYVACMHISAEILLSGFLEEDTSFLLKKAEELSLELVVSKNKNKWQMLHLKKV